MNEKSGFARFDSNVLDFQAKLREAEGNQDRPVSVSPKKGVGRYSGRVVQSGFQGASPATA